MRGFGGGRGCGGRSVFSDFPTLAFLIASRCSGVWDGLDIALLIPSLKRGSSFLEMCPQVRRRVWNRASSLLMSVLWSIVGRSVGFGLGQGQLGLRVGDKSWEECTGKGQGLDINGSSNPFSFDLDGHVHEDEFLLWRFERPFEAHCID